MTLDELKEMHDRNAKTLAQCIANVDQAEALACDLVIGTERGAMRVKHYLDHIHCARYAGGEDAPCHTMRELCRESVKVARIVESASTVMLMRWMNDFYRRKTDELAEQIREMEASNE